MRISLDKLRHLDYLRSKIPVYDEQRQAEVLGMIKDKICYLDTLYIVVNEKKNKFDVDFLRQHCGYGDDESVIVDDYPWGHTDKKTGEWIVDLKWPTMFKVQQPRRPVLEYFLDWSEGFAGDIVLPGLISLWTL